MTTNENPVLLPAGDDAMLERVRAASAEMSNAMVAVCRRLVEDELKRMDPAAAGAALVEAVRTDDVVARRVARGLTAQASRIAAEIDCEEVAGHLDLSDLADYIDNEDLSSHVTIDYDSVAEKIDLSDLAQHFDMDAVKEAATENVEVDYSEIAEQIDLEDLASECVDKFTISAGDVAAEVDVPDLARHVDVEELAEAITKTLTFADMVHGAVKECLSDVVVQALKQERALRHERRWYVRLWTWLRTLRASMSLASRAARARR